MSAPLRQSGLQKAVLHLYRRAMRIPATKPPLTRPKFHLLIRSTLRTMASSAGQRDIVAIEFLMRKATKMIEGWEDASVKDCTIGKKKIGSGRRIPPR